MTYPNTQLFINGQWQDAKDGKSLAVFNPATGKAVSYTHLTLPTIYSV